MSSFSTVAQMSKMLRNLDRWLEKSVTHATAKKFDPNVLVHARLAPDQYPLVRQVQSACDAAKFAACYLSGTKPPSHPDTEQTIEELRARIHSAATFIESLPESSYAGGDERKVSPPWLGGKWLRGDEYLTQAGVPNFYFHVTTAYAILRHNGVDLGKIDYIGSLPIHDG